MTINKKKKKNLSSVHSPGFKETVLSFHSPRDRPVVRACARVCVCVCDPALSFAKLDVLAHPFDLHMRA